MKVHIAPIRLAFVSLLLAALACSPLARPGATPPPSTPAAGAGTAGPQASAPASTPAPNTTAAATGTGSANTLLAVAVRLDGGSPTLEGYLGDPAQAPFQPAAGRYWVEVVDAQGLVLSLGAVNVTAGQPVALPASVAGGGGKADAKQAAVLNTLGKLLIESQLAKLDTYAAVSAGFTQPLFAKAVQPGPDSLTVLEAHNAEISSEEQAVLAAAATLQTQLPAAFRQPGGAASRLAALAPDPAARPAAGLVDKLAGFFGYARDTGKRARERIIQISSGLSASDKADAFDALRSGFKGSAQNYDDWLAQLADGKLDDKAAQIESDLRNSVPFATAAQQANDTVGQIVKREGAELVTKGVELNVEVIKTALGQLSPELTKGYNLAEKGAKWAQFAQDLYNNPLNAAENLAREKLQEKISEKIKGDLADCCPELPSSAVDAIAKTVSQQIVDAIPPLTATATGEAPAAKPDQFTKANLSYLAEKVLSNPGDAGPPNWCFTGANASGSGPAVPPLTVAPDGTLTGVCQGGMKALYPLSWTGSSGGQWDATAGTVTWSVKMTIVEQGLKPGQSTIRTVVIDGSGPVTTSTDGVVSAQGTAQWTDACAVGGKISDGFPRCLVAVSSDEADNGYKNNGTLDWKITFVP